MKTRSLFWGLFLITLGGLYLLDSYASLYIDWYSIADFWPLIFIFWGLCVIFKKNEVIRPIVTGATGFWLAIILYTFFLNVFCCGFDFDFDFDDNHYNVQNYSQEYDPEIEEAKLIINGGAGKFMIKGATNKLAKAKAYTSWGDYDFDFYSRHDGATIEISHSDSRIDIFDFDDDLKNKLEVQLNAKPIWNLDVNIGAAYTQLDLTDYKVNHVDVNTGATKTKIILGNLYDNTEVDVEMGAATLIVEIPKDSGCKLTGDMVLVLKSLDGFTKKGNDRKYYVTDNFQTSKNKIYINVDGGVASLKIKRI